MVKKVAEKKLAVGSRQSAVGKIITKKMKEATPTLGIAGEREIASDFAMKVYGKFDQMIKSVVLFGSSAKKVSTTNADIEVINNKDNDYVQ